MGGSVIDISRLFEFHLSNTIMKNNTAYSHGGCILGKVAQLVNINNSSFIDNASEQIGGAIHFEKALSLTMDNVLAQNNTADKCGFMFLDIGTITKIENSIFKNNTGLTRDGVMNLKLFKDIEF